MEARPGTTTVRRTRCSHQLRLVPGNSMAAEPGDLASLYAMVSVTVSVTVVTVETLVDLARLYAMVSATLNATVVQVELPPC